MTSLKMFNEAAPEYDVLALVRRGIAMHPGFSFPVGKVSRLKLYPMSFVEFLYACKQYALAEMLESKDSPLINVMHDRVMTWLRYFMYTGACRRSLKRSPVLCRILTSRRFVNCRIVWSPIIVTISPNMLICVIVPPSPRFVSIRYGIQFLPSWRKRTRSSYTAWCELVDVARILRVHTVACRCVVGVARIAIAQAGTIAFPVTRIPLVPPPGIGRLDEVTPS